MSVLHPVVFVLDDDEWAATILARTLQASGFVTRIWTRIAEFLAADDGDTPGCLVTDIPYPARASCRCSVPWRRG